MEYGGVNGGRKIIIFALFFFRPKVFVFPTRFLIAVFHGLFEPKSLLLSGFHRLTHKYMNAFQGDLLEEKCFAVVYSK